MYKDLSRNRIANLPDPSNVGIHHTTGEPVTFTWAMIWSNSVLMTSGELRKPLKEEKNWGTKRDTREMPFLQKSHDIIWCYWSIAQNLSKYLLQCRTIFWWTLDHTNWQFNFQELRKKCYWCWKWIPILSRHRKKGSCVGKRTSWKFTQY